MNGLIVGVYGLYLILVGFNGNASSLAGKVQDDAPKFLPWVIAIFVLAFLHGSSETGRKVTGPFIALLVLSFVLNRFSTLQAQTKQLWDMGAAAAGSSASSTTPTGSGDKVAPAGTQSNPGDAPALNSSPALSSYLSSLGDVSTFLGLE